MTKARKKKSLSTGADKKKRETPSEKNKSE